MEGSNHKEFDAQLKGFLTVPELAIAMSALPFCCVHLGTLGLDGSSDNSLSINDGADTSPQTRTKHHQTQTKDEDIEHSQRDLLWSSEEFTLVQAEVGDGPEDESEQG